MSETINLVNVETGQPTTKQGDSPVKNNPPGKLEKQKPDVYLSAGKHLNADRALNEDGISLLVARMRVKAREQLKTVRCIAGDKIQMTYICEVVE